MYMHTLTYVVWPYTYMHMLWKIVAEHIHIHYLTIVRQFPYVSTYARRELKFSYVVVICFYLHIKTHGRVSAAKKAV